MSTAGICFFGTPHQGADGVDLAEIVLRTASVSLNTSHKAIRHLHRESEWLETQLGQFAAISQDFETIFLYESYPISFPGGSKIVSEFEHNMHKLAHHRSQIVNKASAVVPGAVNNDALEIRKDHHTMVKFDHHDDSDFQTVAAKLVSMAGSAEQKVSVNWAPHASIATFETRIDRAALSSPSGFRLSINLPFSRNRNFTGRGIVLDQIRHALESKHQKGEKIVTLDGAGGFGKTQVALEYAYLHASDYTAIIWIDAQSHSTAVASFISFIQRLLDHQANSFHGNNPDYLEIASNLHLNGMVDRNGHLNDNGRPLRLVEAAKYWLQSQGNDSWLVVYDNVDDLESFNISDFLPGASHGSILLTSRRTECRRFGTGVALDTMGQDESLSLFATSLGRAKEVMSSKGRDIIHKSSTFNMLTLISRRVGALDSNRR